MEAKMNKQERDLHRQQVAQITTSNANHHCHWCGTASCNEKGYLVICLQLAINTGFTENQIYNQLYKDFNWNPGRRGDFQIFYSYFCDQVDGIDYEKASKCLMDEARYLLPPPKDAKNVCCPIHQQMLKQSAWYRFLDDVWDGIDGDKPIPKNGMN
jgi:hypothetical protein